MADLSADVPSRFIGSDGEPNIIEIALALDAGTTLPPPLRRNYEVAEKLSSIFPQSIDVLSAEELAERRDQAIANFRADQRAAGLGSRPGAGVVPQVCAIVIGTTGAGKSSTIAVPVARDLRAWNVDPDLIKPMLTPEYRDGYGNQAVHAESAGIRRAIVERIVLAREPFVYQTIGEDAGSTEVLIRDLRAEGYRVWLYLVHLPATDAALRVRARFEAGGQGYIPASVTARVGESPLSTYNQVKDVADGYARIDNGHQPTLVEVHNLWLPESIRSSP